MALKSMTGFGRGQANGRGLRVEVELSSINRKQLDIRINFPRNLSALESHVARLIGKSISRGCVTGAISVRSSKTAARGSIHVNEEGAEAFVSALRKAAHKLGLKDDLSAQTLLQLPDVVKIVHPEIGAEATWPVVTKAIAKAITSLTAMRKREGLALEKDMRLRLKQLCARVNRIAGRAPKVAANYRKTLLARLKEAGVTMDSRDPELLKKLALFADRCDIAEEITRLNSHMDQAAKLLSKTTPVGRTLDFLAQEMFREIIAIGSKANDTGISRQVIAFKAELERIREQVQNVE